IFCGLSILPDHTLLGSSVSPESLYFSSRQDCTQAMTPGWFDACVSTREHLRLSEEVQGHERSGSKSDRRGGLDCDSGLGRLGRGLRGCLGGGECFLKALVLLLGHLAALRDLVCAGPGLGMCLGVVFARDQQVLKAEDVSLMPLVVRQLEILIHLDG